jgi:uncharacterized protein YcbX
MKRVTVAELRVYPLKAARGIVVPELTIGRLGPDHDHRWVVVDAGSGMFVAQRGERRQGIAIPEMSQIQTAIAGGKLRLTAPGMDDLELPLTGVPPEGRREAFPRAVTIWGETVAGIDQGEAANEWVTTYLSRFRLNDSGYRLMRWSNAVPRLAPDGGAFMTYADGWPLLVASTASLADLNARIAKTAAALGEGLPEPLGWDRFRPALVLDTDEPYLEDRIASLSINGVELVGGTQCIRCLTTTTNQETSVRGKEPLRTLNKYRRSLDPERKGVLFARNFRHAGTGVIRVGDEVEVELAA